MNSTPAPDAVKPTSAPAESRRLNLRRESLRELSAADLGAVVGGYRRRTSGVCA